MDFLSLNLVGCGGFYSRPNPPRRRHEDAQSDKCRRGFERERRFKNGLVYKQI